MTVEVRVDMPESTGVHVHEPQHHRHVGCGRRVSPAAPCELDEHSDRVRASVRADQ